MSSGYGSEFLALALVHFVAVIVPGPDFAITVRQSLRFGRSVGMVTAAGIGAGISLHVGYTLVGVGALLHTYPKVLSALSMAGALYLIYMAIGLLRSRPGRQAADLSGTVASHEAVPRPSLKRAFALGFFTNASNPKATLFFLSIFTTLVHPMTPLSVQSLYGLWMCCVNAAWFMLVAAVFTKSGVRGWFLGMGYWLERLMGVVLMAFAMRLMQPILAG